MKRNLGRALWSMALAALSVGVLLAQDFTGTWQGTAKNPGNGKEMRIVAKISQGKDGKLAATFQPIDQPSQPQNAAPFTPQGSNVRIEIPGVGATFEGRLTDPNTLTGTLNQGQPVPLTLVRATPETAWAIPEPPPPPKQMAADVDPTFEVATIKPSAPDAQGQGINVNGQGMFSTRNTPLRELLIFAYAIHPSQLSGLPAWAETDRYDIQAKPDHEGMGNEKQIRSMMKKLIVERFQLKFHSESKELAAYSLNVDKSGPKMLANDSGVPLPGFGNQGLGSIRVRNASMSDFAGFLQARIVDRPVVDKTNLGGKYDFTLTWRPDVIPAQGPQGQAPPADIQERADIFTAMKEQLGLQFQAEKLPIDVMVIDKVAKPSEN